MIFIRIACIFGILIALIGGASLSNNLYNSWLGGQFAAGDFIANSATLVGYGIAYAVVGFVIYLLINAMVSKQ